MTAKNWCVNLYEFDVSLHRKYFHFEALEWSVFIYMYDYGKTPTSTQQIALYCMSHEQRCNQKLQGILRVHFAFIYLQFKIFMCAIHQIGYVRFSGVKYV